MNWTDERVELLKKLWADGLSGAQIATEMGGMTRNAVIGKVHRLGLSGRSVQPSERKPRVRKPRTPKTFSRSPWSPGAFIFAASHDSVVEPELIEIPLDQRKTLLKLTEKTCRWPVGVPGDAEFFFCGGASDNLHQRPYCSFHSRIGYQPQRDRSHARRVSA